MFDLISNIVVALLIWFFFTSAIGFADVVLFKSKGLSSAPIKGAVLTVIVIIYSLSI